MFAQKMSKLHWCTEKVIKFLDLYEQHECLWNTESDSYKNYNLKKIAMQEIVREMHFEGLTVAIVKEKIKSIRTIYRRELNKIINSRGSGTKDVYKPKLFWFQRADMFLRSVTVSRSNTLNLECSTNVSDIIIDSDENSSEILDTEDRLNEDNLELQTTQQKTTNTVTSLSQPPRRKQKHIVISEIAKSIERLENIVSYKEPEEHEFDIFGKSVAAQLKTFPLLKAIECQQKIQDLLFVQRIELLRSNVPTNSMPSISITDISHASTSSNYTDLPHF